MVSESADKRYFSEISPKFFDISILAYFYMYRSYKCTWIQSLVSTGLRITGSLPSTTASAAVSSSSKDPFKKIRKPYTFTVQRELDRARARWEDLGGNWRIVCVLFDFGERLGKMFSKVNWSVEWGGFIVSLLFRFFLFSCTFSTTKRRIEVGIIKSNIFLVG